MRRTAATIASAFSLLWLATAMPTAWAGQPLATDDSDVKAAGECEWESALVRTRSKGAPTSWAWTTQLGCGTGLGSELAVTAGRASDDGDPSTVWAVAGKHALKEREGDAPGLAFSWSVMADKAPGAPPKAHGWLGSLVASQSVGEGFTAHLNLGLSHDRPTHRTRLSWAVAGEHALAEAVDLTAEAFGAGRDQPSAALGLRWTASDSLTLGAAWTHQFSGPTANTGTLIATLAF